MKDQNKYYRKMVSKNLAHRAWMSTYLTKTFNQFKIWLGMDCVPDKIRLMATLRIYENDEGELFVRIGNHLSYTSGYWFKQGEDDVSI